MKRIIPGFAASLILLAVLVMVGQEQRLNGQMLTLPDDWGRDLGIPPFMESANEMDILNVDP